MRKKIWIRVHDSVLLSLRDYQDNKADIIHVYNNDEIRLLKSYGELPANWGSGDDDITISDMLIDDGAKSEDIDEDEDKLDIDIDDI